MGDSNESDLGTQILWDFKFKKLLANKPDTAEQMKAVITDGVFKARRRRRRRRSN